MYKLVTRYDSCLPRWFQIYWLSTLPRLNFSSSVSKSSLPKLFLKRSLVIQLATLPLFLMNISLWQITFQLFPNPAAIIHELSIAASALALIKKTVPRLLETWLQELQFSALQASTVSNKRTSTEWTDDSSLTRHCQSSKILPWHSRLKFSWLASN